MKDHLVRFAPEWRRFTDPRTQASVLQWTAGQSMNHHLYFTNPTVSFGDGIGLFVSYRSGYPNLYGMDFESGEITQFSDRVDINPFSPAPSRTSPWIYFSARNAVWTHSSETGESHELCRFNTSKLGNCSLSADGSLLAISLRSEEFCELALVETATGKSEILTRAKEIGHIQFCPRDSNLLMYSGTVTQRIWIHDRRTHENTWVYPQSPEEWIVHESWLGQGDEIIFSQWPTALRAIRADGSGSRTIANVNAWHACSNHQGTQIVCDTNHPDQGLLLVDPADGKIFALSYPGATSKGTQWAFSVPAVGAGIDTSIIRSSTPEIDPAPHPDDSASTYGPQWSHPHPTFTTDGTGVIYTSDKDQWSHVYQVTIPSEMRSRD